MARVFHVREGFRRGDDWLLQRFFHPTTSGTLSNTPVEARKLRGARSMYYETMGWDKNGIPTKTKLEELDMGWATKHLG